MRRSFLVLLLIIAIEGAGVAQSLPRASHKLDKLYAKNPDKCIKYAKKLIGKNKHKEQAYYFLSISYHSKYSNDQRTISLGAAVRYLEWFYKVSDDPQSIQDPEIIVAIKRSIEEQVEKEIEKNRHRTALKYAKKYSRLFGGELEQQARIEAELAKRQLKYKNSLLKNSKSTGKPLLYRVNEDKLITDASRLLGIRFRYGGESKSGFDCSGFNVYVYRQSGIELPHKAQLQSRLGKYVSRDNCRKGDLVFFGSRRGRSVNVTHTGMVYSNENGRIKIIHCPNSGVCIEGEGDISWSMYWEKRFLFIKRLSNNSLLTIKTP